MEKVLKTFMNASVIRAAASSPEGGVMPNRRYSRFVVARLGKLVPLGVGGIVRTRHSIAQVT
ncbi:MAG: hypothetical protein IPK15_06715 [Verrucomicrobia bacterium]|nr:hypothetical protein [Verrucomicrobiota bacterium]